MGSVVDFHEPSDVLVIRVNDQQQRRKALNILRCVLPAYMRSPAPSLSALFNWIRGITYNFLPERISSGVPMNHVA